MRQFMHMRLAFLKSTGILCVAIATPSLTRADVKKDAKPPVKSRLAARPWSLQTKVDSIFYCYEREVFYCEIEELLVSGWLMNTPSGHKVHRATLWAQARQLIQLGPDAVPFLCKWVRSQNVPTKFIATYALEQITGIRTWVPYFAPGNNERTQDSIDNWTAWWRARMR
jgi:hypothetical protein